MNFKSYLSQLNLFFDLATKESTGPVKNLCELFGVSASTVKRMAKDVGLLKQVKLKFCRIKTSYIVNSKEDTLKI
jgi:hypothetical protein